VPKRRPFHHLAHVDSFLDQPITFFTVVVHRRRPLLANDSAHQILRGLWERSGQCNGWFVGRYVLMPDHVHLFARPAADADVIAAWVKMWKSVSSRRLTDTMGVASPLWQAEYFDRFVRTAESYEEKWEYVRNNPVRAGLVMTADAWPYGGEIFDLK
jgi:REP-associated tyrosine transposase